MYGSKNLVSGNINNIVGNQDIIKGNLNSVLGSNNIVIGDKNFLNGASNLVQGNKNLISGSSNFVMGGGNIVISSSNYWKGYSLTSSFIFTYLFLNFFGNKFLLKIFVYKSVSLRPKFVKTFFDLNKMLAILNKKITRSFSFIHKMNNSISASM